MLWAHCCRGGLRGSGPHAVGRVNMPERSPDSAVALEAGAEGYLPDPVAALHPDLCLNIGQHIPAGPHVKIKASVIVQQVSGDPPALETRRNQGRAE